MAHIQASIPTVEFVRPFVAQFLKFDPVTDEDRTAMRLHNRDATPSAIGVPTTRPVITDMRPLGRNSNSGDCVKTACINSVVKAFSKIIFWERFFYYGCKLFSK